MLILGTYGVVLRWFGFSGFVIFQRVRRPTYPQDIHFLDVSCCVPKALAFVASIPIWRRNRFIAANVILLSSVLRLHLRFSCVQPYWRAAKARREIDMELLSGSFALAKL